MNATPDLSEQYQNGVNAANQLLDTSTFTAAELLWDWRYAENMWRQDGRHDLAEYCKGAIDTLQEFLDDKAT